MGTEGRSNGIQSGEVDEVGSVHTCLHGHGMKMVHLRVAVDPIGRRGTDRLWNVPFVKQMYQTWEVRPSGAGTKFSFHYGLRPGVPKADFVHLVSQHAEADVQGLKRVCEAEVRAEKGERRRY